MTDIADTTSTVSSGAVGADAPGAAPAVSGPIVDLGPADARAGTGATAPTLVGRGVAFPLTIDSGGSLALDAGDDVGPALRMVIMTAPGERPMRPDFGCAIWDHVFAPINAATLGQMAHAVRQALSRWEPRVDVERVVVRPDPDTDATVSIEVDYRLRASNDRRNLVFPFYVIPEGGHR